MSRSAAATARRPRVRRSVAALTPPRRLSGPLHPQRSPRAPGLAPPRRRAVGTRPPLRIAAEGGLTLASAVAGVALDVSASKLMDRLVRSRGWIVIVAFGLIGIVAMQVSMLKLNSGIGRAVETISSLERSNASLRGEMSRLSSGDRIQSLAGARGYMMPAPADVTFLRAGDERSDGKRAAKRMVAPDPSIAGPAGSAVAPDTLSRIAGSADPVAGAAPGPAQPAAPATTAAAPAPTTPAPAPNATAPAPTTTAPAPNATAPAPNTTAPVAGTPAPGATAPATPAASPPAYRAPGANGAAATSPAGGLTPPTAQATP
jgi:hypothetical protein